MIYVDDSLYKYQQVQGGIIINFLSSIWNSIQKTLFPKIEEELGPLNERENLFVKVISLINLDHHMRDYRWKGIGRKRKSRICLMKSFILKAIYNLDSTKVLIQLLRSSDKLRRLCGWERLEEIPSEPTFSRGFLEFSKGELTQKIHASLAKIHGESKIAGHISRDSTIIEAREKPKKKEIKKNKIKSQFQNSFGAMIFI